jgi:CubicO group peptidase (beta-lactamase class C family)
VHGPFALGLWHNPKLVVVHKARRAGRIAIARRPGRGTPNHFSGNVCNSRTSPDAGTFFWVDPKEEIVGVYMTQAPSPIRAYYRKMFKALVYQALVD